MIFNILLGSSGLVPVMPIDGNQTYVNSMHFEAILKGRYREKVLAVTLQGTIHVAEAYFQKSNYSLG